MPMLQTQLDEIRANFSSQVPEEVKQKMLTATENLLGSRIQEKVLKVGETIPSFSLPNVTGKEVSSTEFLKKQHLVLNFYRGGW